jgi:UDP-N-acetylglucosamine acyltransferase
MSQDIHPTAIIEPGAEIGEGCRIGAYCCIGPHVRLGRDNVLHSNVVIDGRTTLGDGNELFSFACIGKISQDLKFRKEWVSYSRIGSGNVLREYVTVNASSTEGGSTIVGNGCLLLSYSHVAHDCVLGDRVIVSSDSKMAGHVEIGDHAIVNAKTGIVQFVRIGRFAFIGGFNKVAKDILPYCIADGFPSEIRGINKVGLERNGFSADRIKAIQDAYKTIVRSALPLKEALASLSERYADVPEVREMIDFASASKVGLARPRKRGAAAGSKPPGEGGE